MTSQELAADLYGDRGQPGAARVEMSRLRKLLRMRLPVTRQLPVQTPLPQPRLKPPRR